MVGVLIALGAVAASYALGRVHGADAVLGKLASEVKKLELSGAAELKKLAADVKALLAKIGVRV